MTGSLVQEAGKSSRRSEDPPEGQDGDRDGQWSPRSRRSQDFQQRHRPGLRVREVEAVGQSPVSIPRSASLPNPGLKARNPGSSRGNTSFLLLHTWHLIPAGQRVVVGHLTALACPPPWACPVHCRDLRGGCCDSGFPPDRGIVEQCIEGFSAGAPGGIPELFLLGQREG